VGIWLLGGAVMPNAVSPTAQASSKQVVILLLTAIVVLAWFVWKNKREA
jgi:hypothetical protein